MDQDCSAFNMQLIAQLIHPLQHYGNLCKIQHVSKIVLEPAMPTHYKQLQIMFAIQRAHIILI